MGRSHPAVAALSRNTALPAILAPMYGVSGPEMVIAGSRARVVSLFPAQSPPTLEALAAWIDQVTTALSDTATSAAWGVSMVAHSSYHRFEAELELVAQARPQLVVTALGSPRRAMDAVHAYGGLVFADVNSPRLARKAADAGADGLVLVCGGAGGQTGSANPFGFVDEVRAFFDGPIVLAGAISTGRGVRAAEVMGADFAYVGTRFIASAESRAAGTYKDAVVSAVLEDIVESAAVTGVPGNFIRQSLIDGGYGLEDVASIPDFASAFEGAPRPRAYSAGHGVGSVRGAAGVAQIVADLAAEYARAKAEG